MKDPARNDGRDRERSARVGPHQRREVVPGDGQILPHVTRKQRFGVAASIAAAVFAISILTAWLQYRDDFLYLDPQAMTESVVRHYVQILDDQITHGVPLPDRLEEIDVLQAIRDSEGRLHFLDHYAGHKDFSEWSRDYWDRLFLYEVDGATYRIRSLGRDGIEGGSGHDADIEGGRPLGRESLATLGDFLFDIPSLGILITCGLAAVFTFLASLLLVRSRPPTKLKWAALLVTASGTSVIAVVLSMLHIPIISGH